MKRVHPYNEVDHSVVCRMIVIDIGSFVVTQYLGLLFLLNLIPNFHTAFVLAKLFN